jgi:serine/threonine-protein kinase
MVRCLRCASLCAEGHSYCFSCGSELEPESAKKRSDPLLGQVLPGGYRVTHLVGVGGMGRVYCADQVALGRTVAVKVVHPHLADDAQAGGRFLNEARAASRLSHPNSVAIFDFGRTDDGHPYIVMEFLRGRDLGRVARTEGPLPLRRVVEILRQTLAALGEAHALGIVHRDLKPDNIVLEPLRSGLDFVKVVDFGLAKEIHGTPPSLPGVVTQPGLVCGTPEYMSPEQGHGDDLDGRSDLYSVGVVLFELLAGQQPFTAENSTKTLLLHLTEPPPDPRDVAPDRAIPAVFAELALRSLAKSRDDRFQSARAFADALEQALVQTEGHHAAESVPATSIECGQCGSQNPLGRKFCGECGASIAIPEPIAALPVDAHAPTVPPPPASASSVGREAAANETVASSPAPPPGGKPLRPGALPLLGRDEALAWLDTRRDEAALMPARAQLVGEAGMGKTRVLNEALAAWTARGDIVVAVAPDPTWARISDTVVKAAIAGLAGFEGPTPDPAACADARGEAAAGLRFLFSAQARVAATPEDRRRAVAEALRWSFERAASRARGARIILAIDDVDFVDGTSRNALADLLAAPPPVSALVVMTHMPGAAPVGETFPAETWHLEPLPYEAFASRVPPRIAPRNVPLSPLHLDQLLAWSRETSEPPPERLAEVISRRVDRLSADARHTLHAVAVWGDGAGFDWLRALLPPEVDLPAALQALEDARLITMRDGAATIAHPLLRRVVFSSIPAGRKRELFEQVCDLRLDAPLEVRAKQAMHGRGALEALSLLDAVAAYRSARGDHEGSVSSLRHALDVARRELHRDELDDPVTAILIFSRKLAEALIAARRFSDADGVLREALGSAPPASEHRAHLLGVMAQVANARRHPGEARRYLDEAMRVARQSDARGLLPILERLDKSIAVA